MLELNNHFKNNNRKENRRYERLSKVEKSLKNTDEFF